MKTIAKKMELGFTAESFPAGTHMCLIYSDEEERKKVIFQFIEKGISDGEKVVYFADEASEESIKEWVLNKVSSGSGNGKNKNFSILQNSDTYFPGGSFDPDKMLENLRQFHRDSVHENCDGARCSGEMNWAVKGVPGSERLMEYEAKVNDVLKEFPVTAICQYDANKFDGATILKCLKVHPFIIVNRQIVQNPYYLNTEEYLNLVSSPNKFDTNKQSK